MPEETPQKPVQAPAQPQRSPRTRPLEEPAAPPRRVVPSPEPRPAGELEVTWRAPEPELAPSFLERHERALVATMLLLGLLLRLVPVLWGSTYFDATQAMFHPDEPKLVRPLDDFPGSLETYKDYRYPTLLPFAFGALWYPVGEALGLRDERPSVPGQPSYEAAQVFGRALNVLVFGLGGLLLIWAFTRRLFGAGPALLALAAANTMGRPVTSAALVLPDIAASVLLFATFFALHRAETRPRLRPRAMVPVGLALGAAAAAKYTSGVGALGVLLVAIHAASRRRVSWSEAAALVATAGGVALLTFLFFVPGAVYDSSAFLDSLAFEYRSKLEIADSSLSLLPRAFGKSFPLWLVAFTLIGLAVARRARLERAPSFSLLAAGVSLAVYFALSLRAFRADYALPFFPFVAMFAGLGLWSVARLPSRGIGGVVVALALLLGTAQSAHWVALRYTGDVNYRVDRWIEEHLPPGPLGVAPPPSGRSTGARAPEGFTYVGVHGLPEYILVFQRRTEMVLGALEDPASAHALMADHWGAQAAATQFSMEPGARRLGRLREADLRFYEDVVLGLRRRWKYDLVKEFLPVDSPLDMPGRWARVYKRADG